MLSWFVTSSQARKSSPFIAKVLSMELMMVKRNYPGEFQQHLRIFANKIDAVIEKVSCEHNRFFKMHEANL